MQGGRICRVKGYAGLKDMQGERICRVKGTQESPVSTDPVIGTAKPIPAPEPSPLQPSTSTPASVYAPISIRTALAFDQTTPVTRKASQLNPKGNS
uniref:Uncharacterized protein n=1 Tax=Ditylenchus dipsaci TaxID=166011 RepID=A0A915E1Z9_9BILA